MKELFAGACQRAPLLFRLSNSPLYFFLSFLLLPPFHGSPAATAAFFSSTASVPSTSDFQYVALVPWVAGSSRSLLNLVVFLRQLILLSRRRAPCFLFSDVGSFFRM